MSLAWWRFCPFFNLLLYFSKGLSILSQDICVWYEVHDILLSELVNVLELIKEFHAAEE